MKFKLDKKAERAIAANAASEMQKVVDQVYQSEKGAAPDDVAVKLQKAWKKAFDGKLPKDTLTQFAHAISSGEKPRVKPS
ncbi:hypothetical protein WCD74_22890 [Actinomycetospora sp. OC33-EN08]|uniref:Antitoxin VbhA domain-containing protein n=1 Tax=Actinomycetospora aurantiaca TaxID=3129233 RepID=A0ABU8MTX4_9PSEU